MTARERRNTQFLIDWIHEEMGAISNPSMYKRMASVKAMLEQWLDKDAKHKEP